MLMHFESTGAIDISFLMRMNRFLVSHVIPKFNLFTNNLVKAKTHFISLREHC